MIVPRDINGRQINFFIGATALAEEGRSRPGRLRFSFIWDRIGDMQEVMSRLPLRHLSLLTAVPIIIWNGGEDQRGGWYPPDHRAARWMDPVRTERNFGVNGGEVAGLPNSNGIITITTNVLAERPTGNVRRCMFSITHEIGHCVDHHLDLTSTPTDIGYRSGNRAYQGQRYGSSYNGHEFKAETYSRLFIAPNRLCRGNGAVPQCENSMGHRSCNERLMRDLSHSPAFRGLGALMYLYLRLPIAQDERGDSSTAARGPAGQVPVTRVANSQLSPHARGRVPGTVGMA
jgi:hypothetical protein